MSDGVGVGSVEVLPSEVVGLDVATVAAGGSLEQAAKKTAPKTKIAEPRAPLNFLCIEPSGSMGRSGYLPRT